MQVHPQKTISIYLWIIRKLTEALGCSTETSGCLTWRKQEGKKKRRQRTEIKTKTKLSRRNQKVVKLSDGQTSHDSKWEFRSCYAVSIKTKQVNLAKKLIKKNWHCTVDKQNPYLSFIFFLERDRVEWWGVEWVGHNILIVDDAIRQNFAVVKKIWCIHISFKTYWSLILHWIFYSYVWNQFPKWNKKILQKIWIANHKIDRLIELTNK